MPGDTPTNDPRNTVIAAKSGAALSLEEGETLRVIDVEGHQVADLVCFNAHDCAECLSAAKTRLNAFNARISTGDRLFSNRSRVMLTIGEDTVGVHDLLFASCNGWLYEHVFHQPGRTGCLEIFRDTLAAYLIEQDAVPDPFNLFMKTRMDDSGGLAIELPVSKPGDFIELTAEMDCLVALTSCPEEYTDCNGGHSTPIELQVRPKRASNAS